MKKKAIVLLILSIALTGIFFAANKTLRAETTNSESDVSKKLDEVLNNQKTILQEIAELKNEIYIIKIRVTQQQ